MLVIRAAHAQARHQHCRLQRKGTGHDDLLLRLQTGQHLEPAVEPGPQLHRSRIEQILAKLQSKEFRRTAETLAGYDLARSGKIIARIK